MEALDETSEENKFVLAQQPITVKKSFFAKQAAEFEEGRYAWMALGITIQSCVGSIACMCILKNGGNNLMLIACAILSMLSNALFISLAPAKWCLFLFYLSVLLNGIFILINI